MHNHNAKYQADRDSNLVPPGYKPQTIRMNHRDRPRFQVIFKPNEMPLKCVTYLLVDGQLIK